MFLKMSSLYVNMKIRDVGEIRHGGQRGEELQISYPKRKVEDQISRL